MSLGLFQTILRLWTGTMLTSFLLSIVFVWISIMAARHFEILARPSERGSHSRPTPRLGGMGLAIAFYVVLALMYRWWPMLPEPWLSAIIVGGAWALVGGFLDDVLELPPRWKFLFQCTAAGAALLVGFHPAPFSAPQMVSEAFPPWMVTAFPYAFTFGFIVFLMNAYNFMDGMDGQAALFGTVVSVGIYLPLAAFHLLRFSGEVFVLSSLSGALLGFYLFNNPTRPQGEKTFMGDSGSQFVGFVLAIMTLRLADAGSRAFTFGAALILLSPFLWDVSYTLVRRLVRGENILQAHRSHLYQRLLIAGWSHGQTLAVNFVLWGICYALSQTYARGLRFKGPVLPVVAVSATLLVLLAYTLMVLLVERSARKADQARK